MKIDFHTHPLPRKGFLEKLIERCVKANIEAVAITDVGDKRYNFFKDKVKGLSKKYTWQKFGRSFMVQNEEGETVKFLKSQEVLTNQGHLLTVGSTCYLPDNKSLEDTLKHAQDSDALIIADHPFVPQDVWGGMGEKNLIKYLEYFDAIEWNAQCINLFPYPKYLMQMQANEKAEEFSKEHNLPLIADSDAHFTRIGPFGGSLNQIGLAYIKVQEFYYKNDEQFICELRNRIKNQGYINIKNYNSKLGFLKWVVPLYIKKMFTGKNGHKETD